MCLIEREKLGGECPNFACVPTKALLKAVKIWRTVRHAREFGITTSGMNVDFSGVLSYARRAVETITGGGKVGDRYERLAKNLSVAVEFGSAAFVDAHTVSVTSSGEKERVVSGKAFVIATGSVPFVPPIDGLSDVRVLGFRDVYHLRALPKSLAIIGAGPVGCELATFFSGMGTSVTLIQAAPVVLPREDAAISALAAEALAERGVELLLNATVKRVWAARGGVHGLEVEVGGSVQTVAVESVLLAAGKRSAVEGLGLERVGVSLDERGNIRADAKRQTSQKHVFAAGDVSGGFLFTHTAHHEGAVAGHNAALSARGSQGKRTMIDERVVPRVTFVDPEVASVGLTSSEAKKTLKNILVGEYPIRALGRAVTESAAFGLVKIVADAKTRRVVGGHMVGETAGEVIHELALAIRLKATLDDLGGMIHAFPTFSEAVAAAANSAKKYEPSSR